MKKIAGVLDDKHSESNDSDWSDTEDDIGFMLRKMELNNELISYFKAMTEEEEED